MRRGHRADMAPQRHPHPQTGRHRGGGQGDAVIGIFGHDHPGPLGMGKGDAQRQIVRLGPGAGEHHMIQTCRKRRQQPFGIVQNGIVQVTGMAGINRRLPGGGGDNMRVAMAQAGHIVIAVKVCLALRIIEPDPLAPHQMDRGFVKQPVSGAQQPRTAGDAVLILRRQVACAGGIGVDHGGGCHRVSNGWRGAAARAVRLAAAVGTLRRI